MVLIPLVGASLPITTPLPAHVAVTSSI